MSNKLVKVLVLRTAGTNCDQETAYAFKVFGARVDLIHINQLLRAKDMFHQYHILAIPGGFTYGDDIESGRILANELRLHLGQDLRQFIKEGKLMLGICNGFQILVKAGLLPGPLTAPKTSQFNGHQNASLITNDSGKFEDRWTYLKTGGQCVWTKGLKDVVYFPVAHGEGKFVLGDPRQLKALIKNNQVVFRYSASNGGAPIYPENPNGSVDDIAGITDKTGRILGLMPHPERHFFFIHHPFWTRFSEQAEYGDGAKIFENGVQYVKEKLL